MSALGRALKPVAASGTLRVLAALLSYPDADVRRPSARDGARSCAASARCRPAVSPSSTR